MHRGRERGIINLYAFSRTAGRVKVRERKSCGWKMKKSDVTGEFTNNGTLKGNSRIAGPVYFLIKYMAPLAVLTIFISNLL